MGGNSDIGCAILNPALMDNSTAFSTLGAFVFAMFLAVALSGTVPWAEIQNASLKNRLGYVANVNVSICLCSMCFHLMHVLGGLLRADHGMLNKMSFFEYMMTCPFMMLVFVLLGGPKVEGAKYRTFVMSTTILVLMFGFLGSMVTNIMMKGTCFMFGAILFCGIIYVMNRTIVEHSDGKESLFNGNLSTHTSWYKALGKKIFLTWILFPIWWILSPDGFSLLTDSHDVDSLVKLLLNCLAKGSYVLYIRSLQSRFKDQAEDQSEEQRSNYADEQGEWRSTTKDIECGDTPAMVDCQPPSSEKLFEPRHSFQRSASTCSTRSSSKEHSGVEKSLPLPEMKSFCTGPAGLFEACSIPSEGQLGSEELPPPSAAKRQLEAQSEETSTEITESDQIKLLWQQIQLIQSKMEMPKPSQVSSLAPEPALSL